MNTSSTKRYLLIFFVVYVIAAISLILFKRGDIFPWIGGCHPGGYDDDHYMAYCHTASYGDYEHWAVWHDFEPGVLDALRKAKLLFMGNSASQYAFSTKAVNEFAAQRDIPYYSFGFGMGSGAEVPKRMIKKFGLKPKVLVVNADPFFWAAFNGVNVKMLQDDSSAIWEHDLKKKMQAFQRETCKDSEPGWLAKNTLCKTGLETIYRNRHTGQWMTKYYRPDKRIPVAETENLLPQLDTAVAYAKDFSKAVDVPLSCIVISAVPRSSTDNEYLRRLSKATGMPAFIPSMDGLTTEDGFHLSEDSAERWSAELMSQAEDTILKCLQ